MADSCDDIIHFAASFASLTVTNPPNGGEKAKKAIKIRISRGVPDVMYTLGHYFSQNATSLRDVSVADRLRMAATAMTYVADNLET